MSNNICRSKKASFPKYFVLLLTALSFLLLLTLGLPSISSALDRGDMLNYCQTPPFITGSVKPNLLLMLDNSASMYDLAYLDKGNLPTRQGYYCYDQTYSDSNTYAGYFNKETLYAYNFTDLNFQTVVSLGSCAGGEETKTIENTLLVCVATSGTTKTVTKFNAKGNYLNWLSASKFDVEKKVLTGGKYDNGTSDNGDLIAESRGCVGRKFLKEALTADYVEGGTNTSLGITFAVRGPAHPVKTLPSPGGQTFIDIYYGNFNEALCQKAVDAFIEGHDPASIKKAVDDCLSATTTTSAYCADSSHSPTIDPLYPRACTKDSDCIPVNDGVCASKKCTAGDPAKIGENCNNDKNCNTNYGPCETSTATTEAKENVVFGQSIQACWALDNGTPIGIDEVNTVKNQCSDLYDENKICNGGTMDGKVCTISADCPGGGTCINGPSAIRPGNPSYLCSSAYVGACASSANNWVTTTWIANGYSSANECITIKHEALCGDVEVPPVIDPSDDPSTTENYDNLPAIIGDIGIEAQLGSVMLSSQVKVNQTEPPTGLLKEFEGLIRFGSMTFNNYGSSSECPASVSCTKVCSVSGTVCTTDSDCLSGQTCVAAANLDGGQLIHHIESHCSTTIATPCKTDTNCPSGETCVSPAGDHSTGLIRSVDDIIARTWTPFAEGIYNAIGYFAKTDGEAFTVYPGTSRTDLRINASDFLDDNNPSQYRCQQNHVLLITDGMSTADRQSGVNSLITTYKSLFDTEITEDTTAATDCPEFAGSKNLDDLAWLAKNRNIRKFSTSTASSDIPDELSESITTRIVSTATESADTGECNPQTLMKQTALNGCGYDDDTKACYQEANEDNLEEKIGYALQAIAAQSASGTAASVLASGEGTGANLIQALFYPERQQFGSTIIDPAIRWTGSLKNLWYYADPFFSSSTIMEDSTQDNILNRSNDCSITFTSGSGGTVQAIKSGAGCASPETIGIDEIKVLWEAGLKLWDTTPSSRTIYIPSSATGASTATNLDAFTSDKASNITLQPLLQATGGTAEAEAESVIRWVRGEDTQAGGNFAVSPVTGFTPDYRARTAALDLNGDGDTADAGEGAKVWKLGDIVSSTPKIVAWTPLNGYYKSYMDQSYKTFTESAGYTDRGMVFVGANDGMLHAFYLGKLELSGAWKDSLDKKAKLSDPSGIGPGKEVWAFIPKNALPYLKYISDPNYCHVYSIDATPYVFDASIGAGSDDISATDRPEDGSSWRTVLIGGMRLGGACKNTANPYEVQTPADDIGFSSYFALDITDTLANPSTEPVLLWEFSHPDLGFATTGPAIVRISAQDADGDPDKDKNGHWLVVFGSGPTGPIDTTSKQFKGFSNQPLKLFVFDVKQGPGANNGNVTTITPSPAINNAFAGSMLNAPLDANQDHPSSLGFYQDDVLYFGYTQAEVDTPIETTKWTKGGVLRLLTKEDPDPANWALSTVISDIGPVTTSVDKLQHYRDKKLWLYFGTGRYYYKSDSPTEQQRIYGIKEPCISTVVGVVLDPDCTETVSASDLGDATYVSGPVALGSTDEDGWYINLKLCSNSSGAVVDCADAAAIYKPERVIASPNASTIGAVFFTTAKPSDDICSYGGVTYLRAVNYKTGGAVNKNLLVGEALIQVSTGSIEQIDLKETFTEEGGTMSDEIGEGGLAVAPPPIIVPPKPVKRTIHIRER